MEVIPGQTASCVCLLLFRKATQMGRGVYVLQVSSISLGSQKIKANGKDTIFLYCYNQTISILIHLIEDCSSSGNRVITTASPRMAADDTFYA